VKQSVSFDFGHYFERLLACEMTLPTGVLHKQVVEALTLQSEFTLDPRAVSAGFVYAPQVHQFMAEEKNHNGRIVVVADLQSEKGRIVDLGIPLVRKRSGPRTLRQAGSSWLVFVEVKTGVDVNQLWRDCWTFFQKVKPFVGKDKKASAVFLSRTAFQQHSPQQALVAEDNTSAHDSREYVQALLKQHPRHYAVVEVSDGPNFQLSRLLQAKFDPKAEAHPYASMPPPGVYSSNTPAKKLHTQ
jgi:hypothetical protein